MIWTRAVAVSAFLAVCFSPWPSFSAEVYEWRDDHGNVHFTDDFNQVPLPRREAARRLSMPEERSVAPVQEEGERPSAPPPSEGEDEGFSPPFTLDPHSECVSELRKEKDRLSKQLLEDQNKLDQVTRQLHLTPVTRARSVLERERAALRRSIAEAQRIREEVFPQKEWECRRKRVELPLPPP